MKVVSRFWRVPGFEDDLLLLGLPTVGSDHVPSDS